MRPRDLLRRGEGGPDRTAAACWPSTALSDSALSEDFVPCDPGPRLPWTWIHGSTRWSLDVKPRGSQQPASVSSHMLAAPQCALPSLVLRHTVEGQHKIRAATKLGRLSLCLPG